MSELDAPCDKYIEVFGGIETRKAYWKRVLGANLFSVGSAMAA